MALVSAVTVFVGWVMSWLVFRQGVGPSPLPDHATLGARSDPALAAVTRVAWPLTGVAFAVFCTWFVVFVARPRTTAVPC